MLSLSSNQIYPTLLLCPAFPSWLSTILPRVSIPLATVYINRMAGLTLIQELFDQLKGVDSTINTFRRQLQMGCVIWPNSQNKWVLQQERALKSDPKVYTVSHYIRLQFESIHWPSIILVIPWKYTTKLSHCWTEARWECPPTAQDLLWNLPI